MRRLCILALFLIGTGAQAATLADAIATADDGWLHLSTPRARAFVATAAI